MSNSEPITALITTNRNIVPSVLARVLGPAQQHGMVARQIGKIGKRHRFGRTAAVSICRAGLQKCCNEYRATYLQHFSLLRGAALGRLAHVVATVALLWLAAASGASAAPEMDQPAPALVVNAPDGTTFDLAKMRGKVVLVNYWATWCAPCRKEMPKLDAFYKRYHAKGLEIIGISVDFERDFQKARKAAQSVSYPTAVAKAITDDGFGIPKGVPITWIIDADGKVRDRLIEVRDELLDGIVVPLLPH